MKRPIVRLVLRTAMAIVVSAVVVFPGDASAQDPGISSELERTASTSPQEKMEYAANANNEMSAVVKTITKLLDAARRDSNLEALQCLNSRLTSVRALVQVSEAAESAMGDALKAGEVEKADHEFRKTAVALHKTRQLLAEAERCTDEGGPDGSSVSTTVIPGDFDETDTEPPAIDLEFPIDPDPVSPFF